MGLNKGLDSLMNKSRLTFNVLQAVTIGLDMLMGRSTVTHRR